jgi:hypothetical protein
MAPNIINHNFSPVLQLLSVAPQPVMDATENSPKSGSDVKKDLPIE